jgi:hypothetical protein
MDCDTLICDTVAVATEPSEEFLAAARAYVEAGELLKRRREELAPLIAIEVGRGVKLALVGRHAGYTPEHVRRIARDHGVGSAIDRTPPARRVADPDPAPDSASS